MDSLLVSEAVADAKISGKPLYIATLRHAESLRCCAPQDPIQQITLSMNYWDSLVNYKFYVQRFVSKSEMAGRY